MVNAIVPLTSAIAATVDDLSARANPCEPSGASQPTSKRRSEALSQIARAGSGKRRMSLTILMMIGSGDCCQPLPANSTAARWRAPCLPRKRTSTVPPSVVTRNCRERREYTSRSTFRKPLLTCCLLAIDRAAHHICSSERCVGCRLVLPRTMKPTGHAAGAQHVRHACPPSEAGRLLWSGGASARRALARNAPLRLPPIRPVRPANSRLDAGGPPGARPSFFWRKRTKV
jgi:hypothetical protein